MKNYKNKIKAFFKDEGGVRKIRAFNIMCILLIVISFVGAAKGFGLIETVSFIANR